MFMVLKGSQRLFFYSGYWLLYVITSKSSQEIADLVNIPKTSKNYEKSPFLMGKSTTNGHFQ